jgi:hypothetical protein
MRSNHWKRSMTNRAATVKERSSVARERSSIVMERPGAMEARVDTVGALP